MRHTLLALLAVSAGVVVPAAEAQCHPGANSNEAKLLAFYSVPIAFSAMDSPTHSGPWHVEISGEVAPVPTASSSIEHASECYTASAQQHSRLTSVFARPRLLITLPFGLAVEGSYVPKVTIGDAHPELGSAAISETATLGGFGPFRSTGLMLRGDATVGHVRGPITCNKNALQQTDPEAACYGTSPSNDKFTPTMYDAEVVFGATSRGGMLDVFVGSGYTWLRPRFQVDFTSLDDNRDLTEVEVNLQRWAVLGGATVHLPAHFALTGEVYSVPKDVTTVRFAASYRIR